MRRKRMRSADGPPALVHAVALGLVQGPTELLPVSSSAHTELLAWLLRWPYAEMDGERRKSFEVALHTGAAVALALHMRRELIEETRQMTVRRTGVVVASLAPAALAGYALEGPISRRLGGPRSIAAGLAAGGVAMALADRRRGAGEDGRSARDATVRDGLALGVAQALALIPGVSRNGATLAAARARGFARRDAQTLSWHAALPVLFGASALRALRLRRGALAPGERVTLAAGGASALLSTLLSARLLDRRLREGAPLFGASLYRCLLAAFVFTRARSAQ